MEFSIKERYFHNSPISIAACAAIGVVIGAAILIAGPKAAAAILGLILVFCIFANPHIGLVILIILIFNLASPAIFGPLYVGNIFRTASKILALLTLAAIIWHFTNHRLHLVLTNEVICLLILSGVIFASLFYATDPEVAWEDFPHFAAVVFLFIIIIHTVQTPKQVKMYLLLLTGVSVVASVVALMQYFLPSYQVDPTEYIMEFGSKSGGLTEVLDGGAIITRVEGTLFHSNWLSIFLVTVLPLNLYYWRHHMIPGGKFSVVAIILLQLAALALTFTRMGLLGLIFVCILGLRKKMLKISTILPAFIIGVLIIFIFLPDGYKQRVLSVGQLKTSKSLSGRWTMQRVGWEIFTDHWFKGVGFGNYGVEFNKDSNEVSDLILMLEKTDSSYDPDKLGAHNMYLEIAVETGIFGFISLFLFLFFIILTLSRLQHYYGINGDSDNYDLAAVLQISIMAFLFLGLFLHAIDQKVLWVLSALSLSLKVAVFPEANLLKRV